MMYRITRQFLRVSSRQESVEQEEAVETRTVYQIQEARIRPVQILSNPLTQHRLMDQNARPFPRLLDKIRKSEGSEKQPVWPKAP